MNKAIKERYNMLQYCELVDDFDPVKEVVYDAFTKYFKNPRMTKVKNTLTNSIYATKLYCLLNRECRYIITFVDIDEEDIGATKQLDNIKWVSFQTRTLPSNFYDITESAHGYQPELAGELMGKIERINTTSEASTYVSEDFPIVVTLLHTERNTASTYQQRGTIILALETFQTIVTFDHQT